MKAKVFSILALLLIAATGAWAETIDLSTLTADYTAQDGATLTGKVPKNVKISIADGATVTLDGVDISGQEVGIYDGIPGIDCLGDATIILKGENTVSAGRYWEEYDSGYEVEIEWYNSRYSGIYVQEGKTLTIKGNGKLTANGGDGPGIGGAYRINGGNIEIQGGTIIATGGYRAAGIGGGDNATCGYITITTGVTSVTATKTNQYAPYSIGAGYQGSCGTVTIGGTVTGSISTNPYTYEGNPTVAVTGMTLAPTSATLTLGETETVTLMPTVLPDDASNKTVAWTTSNASVATVSNSGVVTAVGGGTCTITATATNGTDDTSDDYTATCAVSVHAHSFTYQASDATITASCGAAGCNITNGLTLTISAPTNLTFDYEPKEATLNNDYNTTAFPGTYAIEYYQGETKLGGAPVNAGSYKTQVTAEGKTAFVEFTISGQEAVSYMTKTKQGGNWLYTRRTITEYLLVQSKSDDYYLMQDGRTYVVKGNQTLSKGLVYEGTVNLILCANSSLTIQGGIWHVGSELNIYAEEGAEQTATISLAGTTTQPALSGGTIVMNSGNLSATAADGGQLVGDSLVLLLNYGVSDINLSGGEEQENGLVKYTATQVNALSSLNLTSTPATKYDLTVGESEHGTVQFTVGGAAAAQAYYNEVVTVTVTPDEGYSQKDVTVRAYTSWDAAPARALRAPSLVDDITVTKQQDGTWTFTMPEANVWVVVTYTKDLQDAWIEAIADQTYTGEALTPAIVVKDGETTLTLNTDYTVAYADNTAAGTATVTVSAVEGSDYSGQASATFTIQKADITMTTAPAAVADLVYSGEPQTLVTAGVASFGTVLYSTDGTNFSDALPQKTDAGTYTVTYKVEGDANHNAFAAQTLDVTIAKNKTALNTAITDAEAYYNSIKVSNPDAAATLLEAINAAKAVKDNADATQTEIENATTTLGEAVSAAQADVALKRITITIPAKSYVARVDADKRQIETAVAGVSLYSVKSVTDSEVELTAALSVVAAEMPYLIYNDNDEEKTISIVVSSEDADNVEYDSDHFKGTLVDKTFTDEDMAAADHYVLQNGKDFVWVKDAGTLSAGKCWIELIPSSEAHALRLVIVNEGGTVTGINAVSSSAIMDGNIYDLSGRRVAQPTKGLFIVNGKKVVVK